jgi:hypothetical protein
MYITAYSGKDSIKVGPGEEDSNICTNPTWFWRETGHGSCSTRCTSALERHATKTSLVRLYFVNALHGISRYESLLTFQEELPELYYTHSS